ncbi:Aminodeoxychorismate synthase component 1 [Chlamydiales bacterium SCGC AB-751-O23]|nr:Aminodeoxychorismate synthase component 1 [Chlamydiales bacterium SCGC AB-751-O23]
MKDKWVKLPPSGVFKNALCDLAESYSGDFGSSLFYSGGEVDSSQGSYLCLFPSDFFSVSPTSFKTSQKEFSYDPLKVNPWELIKEKVGDLNNPSKETIPLWVGYLSYEMGAYSHLYKFLSYHTPSVPLAYFVQPTLIIKQNKEGDCFYCIRHKNLPGLSKDSQNILSQFLSERNLRCLMKKKAEIETKNKEEIKLTSKFCRLNYADKFSAIKKLLSQGDLYQVNLSEPFIFEGTFYPFEIFKKLIHRNPSSFSAYLNFDSLSLVSSSPERFVLKNGEQLEVRPVKGTIKRGVTLEEDKALKEELISSKKDQAELLMIIDLLRNDLSKVSLPGSVKVNEFRRIESYENVYHALSIIQSKAKSSIHPVDIVREVYPGGSITGCPKIRSMQAIYDLEKCPRGIYTGSIGYFSSNGDFDFNIAIRTLSFEKEKALARFGGAIVMDSILEKEIEEILVKGSSIFSVMKEV